MRRLFALMLISSLCTIGTFNSSKAAVAIDTLRQESISTGEGMISVIYDNGDTLTLAEAEALAAAGAEPDPEPQPDAVPVDEVKQEPKKSFHQVVKQKFIEGGAEFMGIVLFCLIMGLALCIERIIYLNLATTNTEKLLNKIESSISSGGVDAAKEVCRNTKGPVASIFYQGLERSGEGIDVVEKAIVSYGSVQMGLLEKGLSWISLFISLAPMLGFMGTVIGMIDAFDAIEDAGDISPSLVAHGIKVALLTTVFGLIVAIILQIFYNYLVSKIDSLVNSMEDASISLIDILVKARNSK
jgi:biopolymer transport protein ExbB